MYRCLTRATLLAILALSGLLPAAVPAASLPDTIDAIRGAVVAVGTYEATRRPPANFLGTGFVVGDGTWVITNAHVVDKPLDPVKREFPAVFAGRGNEFATIEAKIVQTDPEHDLALLKLLGAPLPTRFRLAGGLPREGQEIAFTGFPIGVVLGLYPVTHRGIVSAITPVAIPAPSAGQLDANAIRRLSRPFNVLQLDATAYPGNSGSPLYDPASGRVYGVINSVFIKETKENVIQKPSGITYAIPVEYLQALMRKAGAGN
ncbi:MAG TPA: serine protease [Plasticicumulans sp.]|uniref:S1 family peptidase n=1 Tax=Plasticicumulans sp. TaxID=2307179 RepID=UPI002C0827C8|nr:serine protease [Plasticicumulans sp.]HMV39384.1 serine protease [Plasticicumulans sp.]HMW31074.1 serine protease [Plasticicumulans sp.]HMW43861.1 serine protease [Plasticicumulans sp.]HMX54078.1 serine protease [Plasticicumulans sp.]HND98887.1 serine protease [Plasticicumulans sp.]